MSPDPAATRRRSWRQRSEARPGEIRTAALMLFSARGFGGTRIEDVAEAAGVTVGTVYRYFRDKDALLADLVEHFSATPLLPPASGGGAESVAVIAQRLWAESRREPHAQMLRLMVAERDNWPALVARYRDRVLVPVEATLAAALQGLPAATDPLIAARALLGGLLGASLMGGSPNPLIPQIAPTDITVPTLCGSVAATPRTAPVSPDPAPPTRSRRPDSW